MMTTKGDDILLKMANRLAAASECLGQLAKKGGALEEMLKLREALRVIADCHVSEDEMRQIATKALGWSAEC